MALRQYFWILIYLILSILFNAATAVEGNSTFVDGTSTNNKLLFSSEGSKALLKLWSHLQNESFDATREGKLSRMLMNNAGIYRNRTKAKKIGLQKTVLMSVVSLGRGKKGDLYKDILRNWLCYTAHYDFMPVVYYLSQSDTGTNNRSELSTNDADSITYLDELRAINRNTVFIEYPMHLFWSLLTRKTDWGTLSKERGVVDFRGSYPSFVHHGALVMLVPILEVLTMGFNTVYLDIDIALVKDPIPFMTLGSSDIAVSAETRKCHYATQMKGMRRVDPAYLGNIEPNTGTMMIRATVPGLKLMNKFLLRLVNVNRANDQPYLNRELGNLLITDDCQYLYNQSFDENILSGRKRNQRKGLTTAANRSDSNSDSKSYSGPEVDATMCYLPELLFQNGFMAFTCPVKDKTKEEFLLRMNRYARVGSATGVTTRTKSPYSGNNSNDGRKIESLYDGRSHHTTVRTDHDRSTKYGRNSSSLHNGRSSDNHSGAYDLGNDEEFVAPLTVHANYCGTKKTCFRDRGLWLLESYTVGVGTTLTGEARTVTRSICKAFNKADTKYGRPHWAYELDSNEFLLRELLDTMNVSNVVKFGRQAEVFIIDYAESSDAGLSTRTNGLKVLRGIPNMATLEKLGWPESRDISSTLSNVMSLGRDIIDLTNESLPYKVQDNSTFDMVYASYKIFERSTDLRAVPTVEGVRSVDEGGAANGTEQQYKSSYISIPAGQQYWDRKIAMFAREEGKVNRTEKIRLNLKMTAGVYRDREKSVLYGLESTVLLYELSYDDIMSLEMSRRDMSKDKVTPLGDLESSISTGFGKKLQKFLISMEKYRLNPLLYVSPSLRYSIVDPVTAHDNIRRVLSALLSNKTYTEIDVNRDSGEKVPVHLFEIAYSYPTPLCFSFFRPLMEWVDSLDNYHHCSFTGDVPSDLYFGAMTTLIPALEVLTMGYDVIFIDFGVTMLKDPIPHLVANYNYDGREDKAIPDISFVKEPIGNRDYCTIREFDLRTQKTSLIANGSTSGTMIDVSLFITKRGTIVSDKVQPNLSLMRLKASERSILIMREWMSRIAKHHDRNGRVALNFEELNMTETFNCNGNVPQIQAQTLNSSLSLISKEANSLEERGTGSYCYYNGLSFQAYEVMNHCHKKNNSTEHSTESQFFDTDTFISIASAYDSKKFFESTQRAVSAEERQQGYGYEIVAVISHQGPTSASYYDIESKSAYYGR